MAREILLSKKAETGLRLDPRTKLLLIGGFEKSRPPFFYALIRSDALTLARSAALGGSRHEAKSVSTN